VVVLMAMVIAPAGILAQGSNEPPPRRLEAAFAAGWLGGGGLGAAAANLRTSGSGDYLLFTTDTRFAAAPMIEARVAYPLTSRYTIEGRFGFSRPELRTSISGDVENAPALRVAEPVDQYTFEGALVVMLSGLRFASLVPFASGGAGYLRQLHEGQTLVEEGVAYHVGGGVKRPLFARQRGLVKAAGVRGDARLYVFSHGVEFDGGARLQGSVLGSVFVTF
jgi:hypothetical protein